MSNAHLRYFIDDLYVIDIENPLVKRIYIREILDSGSAEFANSKLNSCQKLDIIYALGVESLTALLDTCFRRSNRSINEYNASKEVELTVFILKKTAVKINQDSY